MKIVKTCSLLIGYILFLSCLLIISPEGTCESSEIFHLYVGGTGPGNYTIIQDAVGNATSGTEILVYPGLYIEHISINKTLRLIGTDKNTTIIDGSGTGSVFTLNVDGIIISGFTIQHSGNTFPNAGITVRSSNNLITNNILINNFYGMVLLSASSNLIVENTIAHNHQCGIYFSEATQNHLVKNTVDDQPFNGFGLFDFSDGNTIQGNILSHNRLSGVNIRDSSNNTVIGNTFLENYIGLHIPPPLFHTMVNDNIFSGNSISLDEEKDFIPVSLIAFVVLAILGFLFMKKRFHE